MAQHRGRRACSSWKDERAPQREGGRHDTKARPSERRCQLPQTFENVHTVPDSRAAWSKPALPPRGGEVPWTVRPRRRWRAAGPRWETRQLSRLQSGRTSSPHVCRTSVSWGSAKRRAPRRASAAGLVGKRWPSALEETPTGREQGTPWRSDAEGTFRDSLN